MADQSYSKAGGVHFASVPGAVLDFSVAAANGQVMTTGRYGATITSVAVTVTPSDWTSANDVVFDIWSRPCTFNAAGSKVVATMTVPKDAAAGNVYVRRMNVDLPPGGEFYGRVATAASNTARGLMSFTGYNWPAASSAEGASKGSEGLGKVYLVTE